MNEEQLQIDVSYQTWSFKIPRTNEEEFKLVLEEWDRFRILGSGRDLTNVPFTFYLISWHQADASHLPTEIWLLIWKTRPHISLFDTLVPWFPLPSNQQLQPSSTH